MKLKRWAVHNGVTGRTLQPRYFFRKYAEQLREAVVFQYMLRYMLEDMRRDDEGADNKYDHLASKYDYLIHVIKD